jgi:hypothetical protein
MIELNKIAAMAGQGGLFLISTALKNGVVLESLDEKKTKIVAGATSKVSILSEISIYTLSSDGSVPLAEVLEALYKKYKDQLPVTSKSDGAELKKLLKSVLDDADFDRVYVSDIKKLVNWYGILANHAPEVLQSKSKEAPAEAPAAVEENSKEEKPKAPKKAAAKKESGAKAK